MRLGWFVFERWGWKGLGLIVLRGAESVLRLGMLQILD